MPAGFRTFCLARKGNAPEEYEDAFAGDAAAGRYALADGATESCFAGLWARLLVEQFVGDPQCDPDRWPACLPALQQRWRADVYGRVLPWYAEAGAERGAFAAFLGLELTIARDGSSQWRAVAVGDSCLFHTRGAALLEAFPIRRSQEFTNVPLLLGSRMPPEEIRQQRTLWSSGTRRPQDHLWMMSDALAHWCLAMHEQGASPWQQIESLLARPDAEQAFPAWIEQLRLSGELQNDDVTLLAVDL